MRRLSAVSGHSQRTQRTETFRRKRCFAKQRLSYKTTFRETGKQLILVFQKPWTTVETARKRFCFAFLVFKLLCALALTVHPKPPPLAVVLFYKRRLATRQRRHCSSPHRPQRVHNNGGSQNTAMILGDADDIVTVWMYRYRKYERPAIERKI